MASESSVSAKRFFDQNFSRWILDRVWGFKKGWTQNFEIVLLVLEKMENTSLKQNVCA